MTKFNPANFTVAKAKPLPVVLLLDVSSSMGGESIKKLNIAVKEMMRTQGGYTLVCNGEIYGTLPLPVMGLMSDAGYESVNEALAKMIPKAHEMGVKEGFDPFITLSFMALPVIPEIRITPRGIYLVNEDRMLRTPFS